MSKYRTITLEEYNELKSRGDFHRTRRLRVLVKCCVCGKEQEVIPARANSYKTCSQECASHIIGLRKHLENSVEKTCPVCGKVFRLKKSHAKKIQMPTCSYKCCYELKKERMSGENNHQYGLRGRLNASFVERSLVKKNNKLTDVMVYDEGNPRGGSSGRVTLYTFLAEQNHEKFNPDAFYELNGRFFLKRGYVVHHKNFDHDDNRVENLEVITKSQHSRIHAKAERSRRCKSSNRFVKGDKIPVVKIALDDGAKKPHKAHEKDVGYDLYSVRGQEYVTLEPSGNIMFDSGVHVQPPPGWYFKVVPNSRLAKTRFSFANSCGYIDEIFTGSIKVVLRFHGEQLTKDDASFLEGIKNQERPMGQLILCKRHNCEWEQVDALDETERGDGGFGSSEKKA